MAVFLSGKAQGSMRGRVEEGSLETPAPVEGRGSGGVWSLLSRASRQAEPERQSALGAEPGSVTPVSTGETPQTGAGRVPPAGRPLAGLARPTALTSRPSKSFVGAALSQQGAARYIWGPLHARGPALQAPKVHHGAALREGECPR